MSSNVVVEQIDVVEQRAFRKVCTREKLKDKFEVAYKKVMKRVIAGNGKPREVTETWKAYKTAVRMYNEALDHWVECHVKLYPKRNFTTEGFFLSDEVPF